LVVVVTMVNFGAPGELTAVSTLWLLAAFKMERTHVRCTGFKTSGARLLAFIGRSLSEGVV
jgi:hypothetical protein